MLKFKVKTRDFLRAIRIVSNAIENEKDNSGIYIKSNSDILEFRALNFNLFIKCECKANILEEGNIIIQYKLIEEFLKKIEDEVVEIEEIENNIRIKAKTSNASYQTIMYKEPHQINILDFNEYKFEKNILVNAIENTMFAASNDESKLNINCIKLEFHDKILKLVSTDSFRLIYREAEILENSSSSSNELSVSLKTSQSLLKIFKSSNVDYISLKTDGTKILFNFEDIEIIVKVNETEFPDYTNILKNVKTDKVIKLNSTQLKKKLELVSLFVKDKNERKNVAEFIFNTNELEIIGFNDTAKVNEKMPISKDNEENIKLHLNIKFILEYLNTFIKDSILEFKMSNEVSAILIREDNEKNKDIYLTMPLKI